jgi:hypothetical protein
VIITPHAGHVVVGGPFPAQTVKKSRVEGGMVQIENYWSLVELEVVYGNDKFQTGDRVYVRSTSAAEAWSKLSYRLPDGVQDLLLVPIEQIVLAEVQR